MGEIEKSRMEVILFEDEPFDERRDERNRA